MAVRLMTTILALSALVSRCSGNAFRGQSVSFRGTAVPVQRVTVEQRMLLEVKSFMGKGVADLQLPVIQKALEPMWASLPKNSHGNLGHLEVRYALRRLFIQRHGWHIDGLEKIGSEKAGTSTAGLLRGRVPAFLMERFEEAFGNTGLKLHEIAIFAATLEHIIHDEVTDRLTDLYNVLEMSTLRKVTTDKARKLLMAFALSIIKGPKGIDSKQHLSSLFSRISKAYPGWKDTAMWVHDLFGATAYLEHSRLNPFVRPMWSFEQVEYIALQISHQFGHFQNGDCERLKDDILQAEDGRTGRVRLSEFYKMFLDKGSAFRESSEGLRNMGALEDWGSEPRVIVSNYLLAPSNCLTDTGFYSICCINECEKVMASVEQAVAAPFAHPDHIVSIVANLSTSTVDATGELAQSVVDRLTWTARNNGGLVPLHGRLFAQWLHLVFPRECPFPHTLGSVNTTTASAYMSTKAHRTEESAMEQYIENVSSSAVEGEIREEDANTSLFQWQEEELLYIPGQQPRMMRARAVLCCWAVGACFAFVGFLVALADVVQRCWPDLSIMTKRHSV